jgi:hypothetical protein
MNDQGFMLEETVSLPVSDDISWQDFVQLAAVKNILLINPSMQLVDVSPEGMPDRFNEGDIMRIQLSHQGLRKQVSELGSSYEEI